MAQVDHERTSGLSFSHSLSYSLRGSLWSPQTYRLFPLGFTFRTTCRYHADVKGSPCSWKVRVCERISMLEARSLINECCIIGGLFAITNHIFAL